MTQKFKILPLPERWIQDAIAGRFSIPQVPAGAKIERVTYEPAELSFHLLLSHEEFPEIIPGSEVEKLPTPSHYEAVDVSQTAFERASAKFDKVVRDMAVIKDIVLIMYWKDPTQFRVHFGEMTDVVETWISKELTAKKEETDDDKEKDGTESR